MKYRLHDPLCDLMTSKGACNCVPATLRPGDRIVDSGAGIPGILPGELLGVEGEEGGCQQPSPGATVGRVTPDEAIAKSLRGGIRRTSESMAVFIQLHERTRAKYKGAKRALANERADRARDRDAASADKLALDTRLDALESALGALGPTPGKWQRRARLAGVVLALRQRVEALQKAADGLQKVAVERVDRIEQLGAELDAEKARNAANSRAVSDHAGGVVSTMEREWSDAIKQANAERDQALAYDFDAAKVVGAVVAELSRVQNNGVTLKTSGEAKAFCVHLLELIQKSGLVRAPKPALAVSAVTS